MQDFVIVAEHFDQSQAIGIAVDTQPRVAEFRGVAFDLAVDGGLAAQHVVLETGFGDGELPRTIHAAAFAFRMCAAISRARPSSHTRSSSGGRLASRAILGAAVPQRRTTGAA